jgi:hypothetical protein
MDNEFADLEAELSRLRPRRPGADLEARIAEILEESTVESVLSSAPATHRTPRREGTSRGRYTTATTWTSWKWANWTVAAALVAVMATFSLLTPSADSPQVVTAAVATDKPRVAGVEADTPLPAPAPNLRPVRAQRTMIGSRVDGVIELDDGSAVERVRDFYVDTIEWRDARGEARLRWELPRESVRYVGLAAY